MAAVEARWQQQLRGGGRRAASGATGRSEVERAALRAISRLYACREILRLYCGDVKALVRL